MEKVRDPVVEDHYFAIPDDYDPQDYFHHQFESLKKEKPEVIQLEIASPIAAEIKEVRWHPTQKIEENSDGSITLTMECNITGHLVKWILQMGGACAD